MSIEQTFIHMVFHRFRLLTGIESVTDCLIKSELLQTSHSPDLG